MPLHMQLRAWLLGRLQSGEYDPGDLLPTERQLEDLHGVSRVTVRRALGDLAAAGYIARRPGRGSVVLQRKVRHTAGWLGGLRDELRSQGMKVESRILEMGMTVPPTRIAHLLGVGDGVPLFHHKRLMVVDGAPFSVGHGYHNVGTDFDLTRDELDGDTLAALVSRKTGIRLTKGERSLEAAPATEAEAEMLEIEPATPVLVTQLLIYGENDVPIAHRRAAFRGDKYRYVHTIEF